MNDVTKEKTVPLSSAPPDEGRYRQNHRYHRRERNYHCLQRAFQDPQPRRVRQVLQSVILNC